MIKHTVDLRGLSPQCALAYAIIAPLFHKLKLECVITSATDGKHGDLSLHYMGKALDLRSKHLAPDDRSRMLNAIRDRLGPQWDVLLEDYGKDNEHFHIEFDPREFPHGGN